MAETPLPSCTYNVQAFPEDAPTQCDKKAIKVFKSEAVPDMLYCKRHWDKAKLFVENLDGTVTDVCNHTGVCPLREGADHSYNAGDGPA